jgi:O-antigen ligase
MILDVLFALGLLLSPASQLRLAGSPVGPGEICLLIWVVLSLGREAARLGPPLTPALSRLLIFWSLFAFAQSLGTLTAYAIDDEYDAQWFLHDVMAYLLLAAASCLSVIEPHAGPRLHRVAWLLCALGTPFLALQFAHAWGLIDISAVDPWWWDQLRGWSANPHQLAVLCTGLALLSLHLAETVTRLGQRIVAVACAILPIYAGLLTKTDSFSVILVAAGLIFVALKLRAWLASSEARIPLRSAFSWIVVLALPLVLVSAAPFSSSIAVDAGGFVKAMSREDYEHTEEKTELRLGLWSHAISRGIEAGMLGLGPGPHLEIPPAILAGRYGGAIHPKNILHPEPSFAPNFEAHNILLDLFVQGGLIAVLSFVWLAATALAMAYRARLVGLLTLLCGLGIYGAATLIIRHPISWFAIALCLVAGSGAARQSALRDWS